MHTKQRISMVPTMLLKISSAQEELIGKMTLEEKAGQLTILAEPSRNWSCFFGIWKTRDRISIMKYQVAQRNLSYLQFKPVVNESISMNVLVVILNLVTAFFIHFMSCR